MIGALMKISHFKIGILSGNHLLIMGLGIKFVAGLFFLIKIISSNENDWLNK